MWGLILRGGELGVSIQMSEVRWQGRDWWYMRVRVVRIGGGCMKGLVGFIDQVVVTMVWIYL
jgi:hypothetical protein